MRPVSCNSFRRQRIASTRASPCSPKSSTARRAVVAKLRVQTDDGRTVERELRAGLDTAEWAHERADVRAIIKHKLAPVFDSRAGDARNSYPAHRYWTSLPLGAALPHVNRIEITNVAPGATLTIWKASLADTGNTRATALAADTRAEFWQPVYEQDQVQILRNPRACPRAWLVAEAAAVDGEEALRRIRGAGDFDPRRTALMEVRADELPHLPGGAVATES